MHACIYFMIAKEQTDETATGKQFQCLTTLRAKTVPPSSGSPSLMEQSK